jgi:hypothetical protein
MERELVNLFTVLRQCLNHLLQVPCRKFTTISTQQLNFKVGDIPSQQLIIWYGNNHISIPKLQGYLYKQGRTFLFKITNISYSTNSTDIFNFLQHLPSIHPFPILHSHLPPWKTIPLNYKTSRVCVSSRRSPLPTSTSSTWNHRPCHH